MGSRLLHLLFLIFAALVGPPPAWGTEIVDLIPVVKGNAIEVSFGLSDAFGEEVERAVASGLPVSFRFTVQLKKVRTLWLNQKVATQTIRTTVTYDNLTERYRLSKEIGDEIVATEVFSDPEAMRRFMVTMESLQLFDTSLLEPNGEYYLRVKGVVRDRNLFLLIPWDVGSGWMKAYFTYLP
jgi:hypothetical protein